jgi:shikimate dehydrogenase
VLLIGAGGAGAGVLGPLLEQRPASVTVANRTSAKAHELAQRHQAIADRMGVALAGCGLDDAALATPFGLVLNASASSLAGAASPVPASVIGPGTRVVDLMYGPAAQPFLDWAAAHGAATRDGLGMLVEQAAEAFLIWRGVRPPSAQVLAELRSA